MRNMQRTSRSRVFGCGLSVFFAALTCAARAYDLNGQDWVYHAQPMGENWEVCTTDMPSGAAERIKEGAARWNYTRFKFTFSADACSSSGAYPGNPQVNQIDIGGGFGRRTLAETTWFYTSGRHITQCDMRFNSNKNWYAGTGTPGSHQFDFLSVAIHEFGHCLSLGHSDVDGAVMAESIAAGKTLRSLHADDLAGIRAIYGAP